jgi:hypothetical protein
MGDAPSLEVEEFRRKRIEQNMQTKNCGQRPKNIEGYRKTRPGVIGRPSEGRANQRSKRKTNVSATVETENFQLDTLAQTDVDLRDCKNRRQLSLTFDTKEERDNHAQWEKRRSKNKSVKNGRDVRGR